MDQVCDNRAEQAFETTVDGARAVAAYRLEGDTITFTHTVVPGAIEGRGVGGKLVRAALNDVRKRRLKVVAQCTFVAAWINKHPEYRDLLA